MEKRKIYIFNSASRAAKYGIGTYIEQLLYCFKDSNIEFYVIYLFSDGSEVTTEIKDGYTQINIPAMRLHSQKDTNYYFRNVAYLLEEFIDNHEEQIFHLNFMTNPVFISWLRKRFRCKIILVCHYTNWSFSLMGDEKKLIKIKNKEKNKRSREEKIIWKNLQADIQMISKCDKFICVAKHTLDTFLKMSKINESKCIVINNALKNESINVSDKTKTILRKKWWFSLNEKIILFVGRLDEIKGIKFLIRAFKLVLKNNPNSRLILVGDGNFNSWLSEVGNYCSKISFTGRLDRKTIKELYCIADVGVVSSLHEEFGLVALEMMMHRIPLIVGDTGGLSEIIDDNISGLKIPIRNINNERTLSPILLSKKINFLLNNQDISNGIGENGYKIYLQKYEIELFKDKMLSIYNNI